MGHFATGVTVVTGRDEEGAFGLTVNAVSAVSLEPTLVLVCLAWSSASLDRILESGAFAVNVLRAGDEGLARRFSRGSRSDRFREIEFRTGTGGAPLLDRALAWLDCRVWRVHEAGDHAVVVGEVLDCDADEGAPLLFFRGRYREYEP